MNLEGFLLARIDDDASHATYATTRDDVGLNKRGGFGGWWIGHFSHYTRYTPARILTECQAMRAMIDDLSRYCFSERGKPCGVCDRVGCRTLRWMALPYADHADYREEWRPNE